MSLDLDGHYTEMLRNAKPVVLGEEIIKPPPGSLGSVRVNQAITLPPINTNISFSAVLPQFDLQEHPGLSAMDVTQLPEIFDWRNSYDTDTNDIKNKKRLITTPGDQKLCGSCWAIAGAGIVSDNFVVSGVVDWKPNLSTTWSLSCYPQARCQGGNPAQLFNDISNGGIVSNHCIDYSWCDNNENCSGSAEKHFDPSKVDLSKLVPTCGCYFSEKPHLLYKIDPKPKTIMIGSPGISKENIAVTVKKHLFTKGPALGGFLVFKNFMRGDFTKINGGVYLDRGVYDKGEISFSDTQTSSSNYVGSHAVAIIGWGVAKNILVDNGGKRADVPYWYCRNSWTPKWGDGGYFKMAMFPYNKMAQFDKMVIIKAKGNKFGSGGIGLVSASMKPEEKTLPQLKDFFLTTKRNHDDSYYESDTKSKPDDGPIKIFGGTHDKKDVFIYFYLPIIIFIVISMYMIYKR